MSMTGYVQDLSKHDNNFKKQLENQLYTLRGAPPGNLNSKKLILLDFWSFNCISCIASFKRLDSLQNEFDENVQIILVNRNNRAATKEFFKKRPKLYQPNLPLISGAHELVKKYPHQAVPFIVWLDSSGKLVQTSYSDQLNRGQIRSQLSNSHEGNDNYQVEYLPDLFDKNFRYYISDYTYWSGYIPHAFVEPNKTRSGINIVLRNSSLKDLYVIAYRDSIKTNLSEPGRVLLEVKDIFPLVWPANKDTIHSWLSKHAFTFHFKSSTNSGNHWKNVLRESLSIKFPYTVTIENRAIPSLVMHQTGSIEGLRSSGGEPIRRFYYASSYSDRNDSVRIFANEEWSKFSMLMRNYINRQFNLPFFDETNISGLIHFEVPGEVIDSKNLMKLNVALMKYGLRLTEELRVNEVLVIRDAPQ